MYVKDMEKWQASSPVEPTGEVDPNGHGVQWASLPSEYVLAGHWLQALRSSAPTAAEAVPAAHPMQADSSVAPLMLENLPAAHLVHTADEMPPVPSSW